MATATIDLEKLEYLSRAKLSLHERPCQYIMATVGKTDYLCNRAVIQCGKWCQMHHNQLQEIRKELRNYNLGIAKL